MFADLKQLPKCDIQTSDFAVVHKKKKTFFKWLQQYTISR